MRTHTTPHALPCSPSTLDNLPVSFVYALHTTTLNASASGTALTRHAPAQSSASKVAKVRQAPDASESRSSSTTAQHSLISMHACSEKAIRIRPLPACSHTSSKASACKVTNTPLLSWTYLHPSTASTLVSRSNCIRDEDIITVVPIMSVAGTRTDKTSSTTYRIIHVAPPSSRRVSCQAATPSPLPVPPPQINVTHATRLPTAFLRRHATNLLPPYLAQLLYSTGGALAAGDEIKTSSAQGMQDAPSSTTITPKHVPFYVIIQDSRIARRAWRELVRPVLVSMGLLLEDEDEGAETHVFRGNIAIIELGKQRGRQPAYKGCSSSSSGISLRQIAGTIAAACAKRPRESGASQRPSVLCIGNVEMARHLAGRVSKERLRRAEMSAAHRKDEQSSKAGDHDTDKENRPPLSKSDDATRRPAPDARGDSWTAPWFGCIRAEAASSDGMAAGSGDGEEDLRARRWRDRSTLLTDLRAYIGGGGGGRGNGHAGA